MFVICGDIHPACMQAGVLPERRWGSSEIKHQKHHGILTVQGRWGDPEGNAKAAVRHPSRPLSSIPSWPESARGSQPNSRPLSRLGPATEQGLGEVGVNVNMLCSCVVVQASKQPGRQQAQYRTGQCLPEFVYLYIH